jgi:DNA sulfur modification protein DndD
MKFEKIELHNWGPYRGHHSIDLSVTDSSPLAIIYGENGKGKTSLAHAILWCLYGAAGKINPAGKANWFEAEKGLPFKVSVTIHFQVHDFVSPNDPSSEHVPSYARYTLNREFTATPDGRTRLGVRIDDEVKSLDAENGTSIVNTNIDGFVSRHLPYDLSRFFIFDGEELSKIIVDMKTHGASIREGIESVMGLPAFTFLNELLSSEQKKIGASMKISDKNRKIVDEIKALEDKIDGLQVSKDTQSASLSACRKRIEEIKDKLGQDERTRFHATRLKELEKKERDVKESLAISRERIKVEMGKNWWLPLADKIAITHEREKQDETKRKNADLNARLIADLERSIDEEVCLVCGLRVSDHLTSLRKKLEDLKNSGNGTDGDNENHEPSIGYRFLDLFDKPELKRAAVLTLIEDERRESFNLAQIKSDISALKLKLASDDVDLILGLPQELSKEENQSGRLEQSILHLDKQLKEENEELRARRTKLIGDGELSPDIDERIFVLTQLQDVSTSLEASFRDHVRLAVQERASVHYREMMNNDDIVGIEITPDFNIHAVHGTLGAKPESSSGQSLIFVYAFIGALIDVSGSDGAWFIDTVGGRLDATKMTSVWSWLATRNRQVIAMPHSGELSRSDAGRILGGRINREYEIISGANSDADSHFRMIEA